MHGTIKAKDPLYVLGHSDAELRRLESQSRFLNDLTEDVLKRTGIRPGMRVIDIGCGAGDVSFLVSRLVGPEGTVIGFDKSSEAVSTARGRAAASGISNVTFVQGDVADIDLPERVDALVGRLTMMYMADPVASLRTMARQVKPGGIIAFQEIDALGYRSIPQVLSINQSAYWITETLRRSGAEIQMGMKLYRTFLGAGLPAPQMIMGSRVEGGPDSYVYEYLAQLVSSLLPMIEKFGVAEAEQVKIETLAERMREEAVANDCVVVVPPLIGAWTNKVLPTM